MHAGARYLPQWRPPLRIELRFQECSRHPAIPTDANRATDKGIQRQDPPMLPAPQSSLFGSQVPPRSPNCTLLQHQQVPRHRIDQAKAMRCPRHGDHGLWPTTTFHIERENSLLPHARHLPIVPSPGLLHSLLNGALHRNSYRDLPGVLGYSTIGGKA